MFSRQRLTELSRTLDTSQEIWESNYLARHEVVRADKDTVKLRIVFDASSKMCGISLNDCLLKGLNIIPLLFDIISRFRLFPVALTVDIEKAFLKICIKKNDRNYQRFLWVDEVLKENPKITRDRFARVVFDETSSPCLLNATIRKR